MGSWHETCALTDMGIEPGDETVMVILDRSVLGMKADEVDSLFMYGQGFDKVRHIVRGKYDDYGGIEDFQHEDAARPLTIFFHRAAWDAAIARSQKEDKRNWDGKFWFAKKIQTRQKDIELWDLLHKAGEDLGDPDHPRWPRPVPYIDGVEEFARVYNICFDARKLVWPRPYAPQYASDSMGATNLIRKLQTQITRAKTLAKQR